MSDGRLDHVPQRTCVACGRKRAKHELLRLVTDGEGNVAADPDHRGAGRGVYLCPEGDCSARVKQGRLQKAFRCPLPTGAWNPHALATEVLRGRDCLLGRKAGIHRQE
jgi:predicted RNA-binding protein YlxR (DUF448 family)